jgi:folate-binding protein YgfZ
VARLGEDALVLLQDPTQVSPIDALLERYVLSSDVSLVDRTTELQLMAFPDVDNTPNGSWNGTVLRPSVLGSGLDVLTTSPLTLATTVEVRRLSPEEVEARRVARGVPKLGVDATEDDLPQEAGMTEAVSFEKGCFLGQEAVAKVRNLGHPRRVLVSVEADVALSAGETVFSDGEEAGRVTSAVGTTAIATVRWPFRDGPFRTSVGAELRARPRPS